MNPNLTKLRAIFKNKKTNLAVAADLTKSQEILDLADKIGPEICLLKLHYDIITDFNQEFIKKLIFLKEKHNFLLFEDRKFADIGHTVQLQYKPIVDWADLVNCHILPGPGIIEALREIGLPKGRGLVLLAQMSSRDHLLDKEYTAKAVEWAKRFKDFVIGFIAQEKICDDSDLLVMTPGVQMAEGGDRLGQQYNTPEAVIKRGANIIIVGRGIYKAPDPLAAARQYRLAGQRALLA